MSQISKRTQYALLDECGDAAMRSHQDDSEDPVVGDTIEVLLDAAAEWADLGTDDFVGEMQSGGQYEDYTIVREDVIVSHLSDEEVEAVVKVAMQS